MIGIYKITSPSGKVYIGQTWNSRKRFNNYRKLYCKCQTKLYNSLKKYGSENHSIEMIHELPCDVEQEIMNRYEEIYIEYYRLTGIELLNLREPGSHGKHSEVSKIKMRKPKIKRTRDHVENNRLQRMKPILQKDRDGNTIKEWRSAKDASELYGRAVYLALQGKNRCKSAYNFLWEYKYIHNDKALNISQYKNLTLR